MPILDHAVDSSADSANDPFGDCWVDIFDADYFLGRMRRLHGPQKLRHLRAKSLIVGPKATVILTIFRGSIKSRIRLKARLLVPDVTKSIGGAMFREVVVESME